MAAALPTDHMLVLGEIDVTTNMRNQLQRGNDWISAGHSIELRTPLVDAHLLASVQMLLPDFSGARGRGLLAEARENPVPRGIIARRKTGLGLPVGRWSASESQANASVGGRTCATYVTESFGREGT